MVTVTSLYICISYIQFHITFYYLSSLHSYCMSHVLCLCHISYIYFYCIPVSILCINHIHSITNCFSCSITSSFIYFCTFVYCLYFSCLIISHILFISSISYSSTYHWIYYLSNGSYYISYSVHIIVIYIYYFHGYIL